LDAISELAWTLVVVIGRRRRPGPERDLPKGCLLGFIFGIDIRSSIKAGRAE